MDVLHQHLGYAAHVLGGSYQVHVHLRVCMMTSLSVFCSNNVTVAIISVPITPVTVPACGLQSGVLIRGNLRADRLEVFNSVCAKVKELFGTKYEVLMIEDPEAAEDGTPVPPPSSSKAGAKAAAAAQEPRVAFQVGGPGG